MTGIIVIKNHKSFKINDYVIDPNDNILIANETHLGNTDYKKLVLTVETSDLTVKLGYRYYGHILDKYGYNVKDIKGLIIKGHIKKVKVNPKILDRVLLRNTTITKWVVAIKGNNYILRDSNNIEGKYKRDDFINIDNIDMRDEFELICKEYELSD